VASAIHRASCIRIVVGLGYSILVDVTPLYLCLFTSVEYEVHEHEPTYVVFQFDNFVGAIWRVGVTEEGVAATRRIGQEQIDALGKIFIVGVAPANVNPPSYEVASKMRDALRDLGDGMLASFVVHQDVGWRLQVLKGVTNSIAMVAGLPSPHKAFGSPEEAGNWLYYHFQIDRDRFVRILTQVINDLHGPELPKKMMSRIGDDL